MTHDEQDHPSPFEIGPAQGRLADYVRAIWTIDVPSVAAGGGEQPVVPDGCPELIFNLGDPIHRVRADGHDVHMRPQLAGQLTVPVTLRPQGRLALVGVRLHPWAMHAFLGVGAREMSESIIPLEAGIGRVLRAALDGVEPMGSPRAFASVMVQALSRYAAGRPTPNASALTVYRALNHLSRGGPSATVRSVSRSMGRSERHLQRVFEESVGLSPKTYLRLARIQRALRCAEREPARSWSEISVACDFYDQSHLIRELQRFAGCTPTQFDARAGVLTRALVG